MSREFKIGDLLICICDKLFNERKSHIWKVDRSLLYLTIGRKYKVLNIDRFGNLSIKNDEGSEYYYPSKYFKLVTREEKLKRILNES